jgi:hypothetical protein
MAIGELTSQMMALKEHGEPDLQMSQATRDAYVREITDYRDRLQTQHDNIKNLADLGSAPPPPNGYLSAHEMKTRLEMNATGLDGIQQMLRTYIAYLDEFKATVEAAFNRVQSEA